MFNAVFSHSNPHVVNFLKVRQAMFRAFDQEREQLVQGIFAIGFLRVDTHVPAY